MEYGWLLALVCIQVTKTCIYLAWCKLSREEITPTKGSLDNFRYDEEDFLSQISEIRPVVAYAIPTNHSHLKFDRRSEAD